MSSCYKFGEVGLVFSYMHDGEVCYNFSFGSVPYTDSGVRVKLLFGFVVVDDCCLSILTMVYLPKSLLPCRLGIEAKIDTCPIFVASCFMTHLKYPATRFLLLFL